MHEQSLARAILREVVAVRSQHGLGAVHGVTVELGEFSGVEPVLLRLAFEELSEQHLGNLSALQIREAPLEAECSRCGSLFRVMDFQFLCPQCGNSEVRITRGEELKLLSVAAEPAEVCQ